MARRNLDWWVGWWSEELDVTVGRLELLLVDFQSLFENLESDVTVERVIGQYFIRPAETVVEEDNFFHTRLTTRQEFIGQPIPDVSIVPASAAEEPFLWHKVHCLGPRASQMHNTTVMGVHPEWSHLDVRVNRRLEDISILMFIIEPLNTVAELPYEYAAWIRVLLKT